MKSEAWVPSHFMTRCDVCGCHYSSGLDPGLGTCGEYDAKVDIRSTSVEGKHLKLDLCDNCFIEFVQRMISAHLELIQTISEEKESAAQASADAAATSP